MVSLREDTSTRLHHPQVAHDPATCGTLAEKVYRVLLRQPRWQVVDIAEALSLDRAEVRAVIAELRSRGLVMASADLPHAVRAVHPDLAMAQPAAKRPDRHLTRTVPEPTRDTPNTPGTLHSAPDGEWTHLDGADEVTTMIERLMASARREVMVLTPDYEANSFEFRPQIGEAVTRNGAALKTVWGPAVLEAPQAVKYARLRGFRFPAPRAAPEVNVRAVIIDRSTAVVLGAPGQLRMLSEGPAFDTLLSTADYLWEHSVELRSAVEIRERSHRPRHETVLQLLAEGHTDQAIARRIGVSVRTVRNDVALVMGSLGARSRFQAGVRAVGLGLLAS